ncbi:hypothetical protein [Bacillus sp. JJ1764]|uniref:hypothetical protein n=1 Tax=Bacillus sp. JJ1764 TaxID=3122964 RepID=UPI00300013AB
MNHTDKETKGILKNKKLYVHNNINLSFHFGDSLNLLALIGGVFMIKTISKQYNKKEQKKMPL